MNLIKIVSYFFQITAWIVLSSCTQTSIGSNFHPGVSSTTTATLQSLVFTVPVSAPTTTDDLHTLTLTAYDSASKILSGDSTSSVLLTTFTSNDCSGTSVSSATSLSSVTLIAGVANFANLQIYKTSVKSLQVSIGAVNICSGAIQILAGAPNHISAVSGAGQVGALSSVLSTPFTISVFDAQNNLVPTVNIDWTVTAGGGSIAVGANPTNALGLSTATLTLGSSTGLDSGRAAVHTDPTIFVNFTATACFSPLDSIAAATAGYSVRRLQSNYLGALIRVRRSNDNAESDIGFGAATCSLDTTALLSFVGSNSAYVKTWYDQTGHGKNATQVTFVSQPRIVNAGVVDIQNGLPAVVFDGANTKLSTATSIAIAGTNFSVNLVSTNNTAGGIQEPIAWTGAEVVLHYPTPGNLMMVPPYALSQGYLANRGLGIRSQTFVNSAGLSKVFQNNSVGINGGAMTAVDSVLGLGWSQPQSTYYWNGSLQEAVVFASTLSDADRSLLELDQLSRYNILPLDGMPVAAAVYSLRRMLSTYNGRAIQVRRSNDNTTQDIGFDSVNNLDVLSLTSFCSTNSCFVVKWYDQNSNTNDALQPTIANQPRIVNAGVVETSGGHPTINFTAVNQNLVVALPAAAYPITLSLVADTGGAVKNGALVKYGSNGGANGGFGIGIGANGADFDSPGTSVITLKENVVWCPSSPAVSYPATPFSMTAIHQDAGSGNGLFAFLNRVAVPLSNSAFAPQNLGGNMFIGGYLSGIATNRFAVVKQSELVVYGLALSTQDRGAIENNQKNYYGLP